MKKVLMIDDQKAPSWIEKPQRDCEDVETFTDEEVEIARTPERGFELLKEKGRWDLLLLDHDLGSDTTGYHILCWLEENPEYCPKEVKLITFNPSAGLKMDMCLKKMEERGNTKYLGWQRG